MIQITQIKCETITKNNGSKEYLIWAVDNLERDWHFDVSGLYGECKKMELGKTASFATVYNKNEYISFLKKYIDEENEEFKKREENATNSIIVETIIF